MKTFSKVVRWTLWLGFFLSLCFPQLAKAQDTRVIFAGNNAQVFTATSSQQFVPATGKVFLFSVTSNASLNISITNETAGAFNFNYQVFVCMNPVIPDYTNNKQFWVQNANYTLSLGYNASGASQTMTYAAAGSQSIFVPITNAAQVAIVINSANVGTHLMDMSVVFTPQGTIPISTVQGFVPINGATASENPVLIGGQQAGGSTVQIPQVAANGGWKLGSMASTYSANGNTLSPACCSDGTGNVAMAVVPMSPNNTTNKWDSQYRVTEFHSATATASGNTAVWSPSSARFRLMCVGIDVTANASLAAAGVLTIQLEDGSSAISGFIWSVYLPNAAGTLEGDVFHEPVSCFNNGYPSSTVSNVLNVNLSSALTTGNVTIRAYGTIN